MQKGDIITIYRYPVIESEMVGEAELIEKVVDRENTESWIVRFIGEYKLERRLIRKKKVKLTKRILKARKRHETY